MLLEEAKFSLQGRNERLGGNNLEAIHQYRTLFFVIATLKYACIGASHQNLKQTDYSVPMLNNILAQVEEGQYAEQVGVQLYYNAYKMLKSVEEAELYFLALKQLLFESNQAVSEKDYRVLFLYAINYCIKRLNSGDTAYIRESFEWYKMGFSTVYINRKRFFESIYLQKSSGIRPASWRIRMGRYFHRRLQSLFNP